MKLSEAFELLSSSARKVIPTIVGGVYIVNYTKNNVLIATANVDPLMIKKDTITFFCDGYKQKFTGDDAIKLLMIGINKRNKS